MTKKDEIDKKELAQYLFNSIDNEGVHYYFVAGGYYDEEDFANLGFNTKKLNKAVEAAGYLDEVFGELEELAYGDE